MTIPAIAPVLRLLPLLLPTATFALDEMAVDNDAYVDVYVEVDDATVPLEDAVELVTRKPAAINE